jgi:hypothetical protein
VLGRGIFHLLQGERSPGPGVLAPDFERALTRRHPAV